MLESVATHSKSQAMRTVGLSCEGRRLRVRAASPKEDRAEQVSDKVLTLPNIISVIRLCFVPVYAILLAQGYDILATIVFAVAAGTDWIDGQIARRTNSVSRVGRLLDPAVDRILMISGVLGVFLLGRIPLWIIVFVVARDLLFLVGGAVLLERYRIRVPVIYVGKVATTLLFLGFAGMLLNIPQLPGLGIVDAAWLPGLNANTCSWGIWFLYAGLLLSVFTTAHYCVAAYTQLSAARERERRKL